MRWRWCFTDHLLAVADSSASGWVLSSRPLKNGWTACFFRELRWSKDGIIVLFCLRAVKLEYELSVSEEATRKKVDLKKRKSLISTLCDTHVRVLCCADPYCRLGYVQSNKNNRNGVQLSYVIDTKLERLVFVRNLFQNPLGSGSLEYYSCVYSTAILPILAIYDIRVWTSFLFFISKRSLTSLARYSYDSPSIRRDSFRAIQ